MPKKSEKRPDFTDDDLRVADEMMDVETEVHAIEGDNVIDSPTVGVPEVPRSTVETPNVVQTSHALEAAPVNSKIVVVKESDAEKTAWMGTPDGAFPLPRGDVAHKLPIGAVIRKTADDRYEATQLGDQTGAKPLVSTSALAAIDGFLAHFHPQGG